MKKLYSILIESADPPVSWYNRKPRYGEKDTLYNVASLGNMVFLKRMLQLGTEVNAARCSGNYTALFAACKRSDVGMMRLLLEYGADVNHRDSSRDTPLIYVIPRGATDVHVGVVRLLLENGADVNHCGRGTYPLQRVVMWHNNQIDVIRLLLEHGADPNHQSYYYGTALVCAVEWAYYIYCI